MKSRREGEKEGRKKEIKEINKVRRSRDGKKGELSHCTTFFLSKKM